MAKKETQEVESNDQEVKDDGSTEKTSQEEYESAFEDSTSENPSEDKKSKDGTGTAKDEKKEDSTDEGSGSESEGEEEGEEQSGEDGKEKAKGDDKSDQEEEEAPEVKKARKKVEAAAEKLEKEDAPEKEEEEPPPPPKKKKAAKKKAPPPPQEEESLDDSELTSEEKEFLEDYPEVKGVTKKIAKGMAKEMLSELLGDDFDFKQFQEKQANTESELATMRSRQYITRRVPDWENIVFDGDKMNKDGTPVLNKSFWGWLDKQPKQWQNLATSENPSDNVVILQYYKERIGQEKKAEAAKKAEEKLKKTKEIHGNAPESGNVTKRKKKGSESFEDTFAEITGNE